MNYFVGEYVTSILQQLNHSNQIIFLNFYK